MKKNKIILFVLISLFVLILINFIFYPAYISTTIACRPQVFEEQYSDDYYIAGETTLNTTTNEIEVRLVDVDKKVLKHELIHVNQFKNRDILTCRLFGAEVFLREVEAYLGQYYPDPMFILFYPQEN